MSVRQMLQQLGITRLRPGPSGNEAAPNHANYEESLANPFPQLPELLRLRDGTPVTTPEMWWQHDGGHTDTPNLEHFLRWAESYAPR